jgi:predicted ATPase
MTERQIKVAFMGTCCVGKTTLLEHLGDDSELLPRSVFVPEAARLFFSRNQVSDDQRRTVTTQGKIQSMALVLEAQAFQSESQFIFCDRSVLDAAVYTYFDGNLTDAERLYRRINFWVPTYNMLYLLDPKNVPYQPDEIRLEDEATRNGIHQAYLEFFDKYGIEYQLLSGNTMVRANQVKGFLANPDQSTAMG